MKDPSNQFIEIAPDCLVKEAIVPRDSGGRRTIAAIEYELLHGHPYLYTLAELKFATHFRHKAVPAADLAARAEHLREEFFAKPYACMRASPLTRTYGWGSHYDEQGRIAIYPVESAEYRRLVNDPKIKKVFALRGKREKIG